MIEKNIHVIMNPASGGGKTGKTRKFILNKIENYLGKNYSLQVTEKPHDAIRFASQAVEQGADLIIGVGGDGTIHEIVNGICSVNNKNIDCALGIISSGTGQDFAEGLGIKGNIDYQLKLIKEGCCESIDIGMIKFNDKEGNNIIKYFANEFQIGIGAKVAEKVNNEGKNKGGLLTYGTATLSFLFRYKGNKLKIKINDEEDFTDNFMGVIAANGSYMGGGMRLTKHGNLSDHNFDLFMLKDQNAFSKILNFTRIYFGRLKDSPLIKIRKAFKLKIDSEEEVLMESDGEVLGTLPCEINLLPSALKVIIDRNKSLLKNK